MPLLTSLINVLIGLQLLLCFNYSFVALRAGGRVSGMGSRTMDTLEARADKFLVNYFLVSMYLDTLKAGGIVDVGKKLGQFLSI